VPINQADAFEEVLDKDLAAASWVSETGPRPATTSPQIGKLRIPAHEIYAMPEATQSLIDDSQFDIVGWLSEKVGQKFSIAEGAAFVTGTGVGQPRGLLNYPTAATADATRAWGTFEHVVTGTNGGFGSDPNGAEKLITLVHKLKAGYRRGAVWLMNKQTAGEVRKLKDTAGRFVWIDSLLPGHAQQTAGITGARGRGLP
jgi:HK97 family phage major capsid protein